VILAYFDQNLVAVVTCLRALQSEMSSSDWSTTKTPRYIPIVSRSNAFVTILVPKLVAMVTPLCPLCTGVSQMNSLIAQALSQNQSLHGYDAYNQSCGHFVIFLPLLAKNCLPWQYPLDLCNQKCLIWTGRSRKPRYK